MEGDPNQYSKNGDYFKTFIKIGMLYSFNLLLSYHVIISFYHLPSLNMVNTRACS